MFLGVKRWRSSWNFRAAATSLSPSSILHSGAESDASSVPQGVRIGAPPPPPRLRVLERLISRRRQLVNMASPWKRYQLRSWSNILAHIKIELQLVVKEWKVLLPCVIMQCTSPLLLRTRGGFLGANAVATLAQPCRHPRHLHQLGLLHSGPRAVGPAALHAARRWLRHHARAHVRLVLRPVTWC